MFAMILTDNLERPVIDRTGLSGHYDFSLTFNDLQTNSAPIGASIFEPIQELGLKLEAQRETIQFLIIDSVNRPSAN